MVRETRHLWVGNLPDNIREDRIREHFKRYGRVQNVKLLGRMESASASSNASANSGVCATVAFMDIKSASKAHNVEHVLDERTLTTEYYEPAAIPSTAGAPSAGSSPAGSGYSGSSSSVNSAPAPVSASRYHLPTEDTVANTCAMAATAAAAVTWRGTNDSATEYCRRGNTPAAYGRYQRNNSTAPYATPPSNVERTTPHHRWYASGTGAGSGGAAGGESTPSTPGGGTERRRRLSGSGSSRSDSSSPEPSDTSRASTPAAHHHAPHHPARRTPPPHPHQWPSTANGRPLAICVRNLPTRSTDSSLKDGLYHEYKKHGKVVWVKVVGQNADRYAVVRFKKPSDVEKALEVSQDKLFFGCKISVAPHQSCDDDAESAKPYETDIDEYHPKATRTLFIGNLEKDVTQQQLRDKFKHFGRIIEIDIKKGSGGGAGYAFCQYASIASVVEAIRAMDGEYVGSSRVKLGFGKPVATTCVWVDGLTEHTEKQVLGAVSRCGAATSVCVDRAAGAALVHFEQAAAAGGAVRELRRVAAQLSAAEPDHPRLCVDYASRECQEAFYEQLEKHGGSAALAGAERVVGDTPSRYIPSARHETLSRYESSATRSRAPSFGRSASRTPRYNAHDHYDPADYAADRRYRVYDELGSSPQTDEATYEDRLQSVVVSPHRGHKHRKDSSPEDRKHSKERHRSAGGGSRRSRSGSRGHVSRRRHRRRRDGSGSRASRAGTPLRDEPDAPPTEPRRPPRERPPLPMSLPLPKFAVQLLRAAPAQPRSLLHAPASPPRPPSASSSSGGSAPHSPSLEERIRSLDEKYERWSGSRAHVDAPDRSRLRHRLLELDINEVLKPSEVVRSLLAKRSVFDEDTERLEGARVPSPGGSPRSLAVTVPRVLRYPFPAHSGPVATSAIPSTSNVAPGTPTRLPEPDDQDRSRPSPLERIPKLPEVETVNETRSRTRTSSIDKQADANEKKHSPSIDKEQFELDENIMRHANKSRRNSQLDGNYTKHENKSRRNSEMDNNNTSHENKSRRSSEMDSTPQHTRHENKGRGNSELDCNNTRHENKSRSSSLVINVDETKSPVSAEKASDQILLEHNALIDTNEKHNTRDIREGLEDKLITVKKEENVEDKSVSKTSDSFINKFERNCFRDETKLCSEDITEAIKQELRVDLELSQENFFFTNEYDTKFEKMIQEDIKPKLDQSSKLQEAGFRDKKEIENLFQNHISKEIITYNVHSLNHLNVINCSELPRKIMEMTPDLKLNEKLCKEKGDAIVPLISQDDKFGKENINCEKIVEDLNFQNNLLLSIEKTVDNIKNQDETNKNERDKTRHCKDRIEKDYIEKEKLKNNKNIKLEKSEKERKTKEENNFSKSGPEKTDKSKSEKNVEKHIESDKKLEKEREPDKPRHIDDTRSFRHENHKKDRLERDKKKDIVETETSVKGSKRDDKYKHDRPKKESDTKREIKTDNSKSRKSSRDESSRDICRKDSTDSSTSRTSHDSAKCRDFENTEIKEEPKNKETTTDIFQKIETDKESTKLNDQSKLDSKIKIKTEIKEEKDLEHHSKIKIDSHIENTLKIKSDGQEKQRHYSLDSPNIDSKRKERLNSCSSLPSNIGHKRRMSSQDSIDCLTEDTKKCKSERRDSKDSRSVDRHKTTKFSKGHFAKIIESKTKDDKKNQVKPPDDNMFVNIKEEEIKELTSERNKIIKNTPMDECVEKIEEPTKEQQSGTSESSSESLHNNIDFLATLELRSSEEDERQKALRKEMKEKKRIQQLQQIQELQMQQDALQQAELCNKIKEDRKLKNEEKKKEAMREKRMSTERKSKDDKNDNSKRRNRKVPSTDSSDSDEPMKKHSIFDIVDDEPTYISMYDKVKARSCKNMQKQEEEKRQEKIKAKFSQLKQSRAKREEKKRSSWDEDSDSESEQRKSHKTSMGSSSDDDQIVMQSKKREKSHGSSLEYDQNRTNDYFDAISTEEDSHNKLSRKNSRSRIMSDTSDDENTKIKKEIFSDSESSQKYKENDIHLKESSNDKVKKTSLLNLFGKSDSDDNRLKSILDGENNYRMSFAKSYSNDISSENESVPSNIHPSEMRKKHKKKQKKYKFSFSDEDTKTESGLEVTPDMGVKHKNSDKFRRHNNKKEKRKDKIRDSVDTDEPRDERRKYKKDKRSPSQSYDLISDPTSNNYKKEGKMEDIFGPLSDESDRDSGHIASRDSGHITGQSMDYHYTTTEKLNSDEVKIKDEIKRKKEKRRKEKAHFGKDDDNSLDVDAVSKAIEARLFADTSNIEDNRAKMENNSDCVAKKFDTDDKYGEVNISVDNMSFYKYCDKIKKDSREKKKKKKRNREDRQSRKEHHHGYHHEKIQKIDNSYLDSNIIPKKLDNSYPDNNITLSPKTMLLDIPLPNDSQKTDIADKSDDSKSLSESPSLPRITDSPPLAVKTDENTDAKLNHRDSPNMLVVGDVIKTGFELARNIEVNDIPMPPPIENIVQDISEVPLPKDPPLNTEKGKQDDVTCVNVDTDVKMSEDAVRSIPNLENNSEKQTDKITSESHSGKAEKKVEEKPRAIISQEETEDAVAALLGESFGGKTNTFVNCYEEVESNNTHQIEIENTTSESEIIPEQDAEEMRQAVQNLNASEMEMKPDTPVSDNDLLLIDTDTEETEETNQDAIEKLPVNIIATNQSLNNNNKVSLSQTTEISNIIVTKPKTTIVHPIQKEFQDLNKKINEVEVKPLVTMQETIQQITSTATPVITSPVRSWTLSNNKIIEPHRLNIPVSSLANKDNIETKPTHITANIVQIKAPHNQSVQIGNSLRPIITPNRLSTPYQVINQMIRPQVSSMQPPTIKIPEPHIIYQKPQGIVISPRIGNEPLLLSPKTSPRTESMTSPRLANMAILGSSSQNCSSVGIATSNAIQQRTPGQVTVVRMQQPPLSPIQTMHIPPGARAMVSPNRPNSVLVQTQGSPLHFNRLPVTPVLAPISKPLNVNNIIQQTKTSVGNNPQLIHQTKIISDTRKSESLNENTKIILSPTRLQQSTNSTVNVMAQNRLISVQNPIHVGNINSTLHLSNKVLINNKLQIADKREIPNNKSEHNLMTPIIHVATHAPSSIIQGSTKSVVCSLQEAATVNRGHGSNVIHTINSQRLLTTNPITNVIQLDANKGPPSVLSMATIRPPQALCKSESSNTVVVTTSSLRNVVMTPLLLNTSTTPKATIRLHTRSESENVDNHSAAPFMNHSQPQNYDKNNESKELDFQKSPSDPSTSPTEHIIAKCETDFEELLKDNTNEIKVTNDPEKKLEINVGKSFTLITPSLDPRTSTDSKVVEKDSNKELVAKKPNDDFALKINEKEITTLVTDEEKSNDPVESVTKNSNLEVKLKEKFEIVSHDVKDKIDEKKTCENNDISSISEVGESSDKLFSLLSSPSKADDIKNSDEGDYWTAKDVNIESVIKKVDSLCNDISDEKKDQTFDVNVLKTKESTEDAASEGNIQNDISIGEKDATKQDTCNIELSKENKSETFQECNVIGEPILDKTTGRRGGRTGRGKRMEKNQDRVQTRQIAKPTRGASKRGRGSRAKVDKKIKNLGSNNLNNMPGDVYDFHEDSGDETVTSPNKAEVRPRLILTIKSPLSGHSNAIATSTLSITQKDQAKNLEKQKEDKMEVFVSPSANTRKSRRLQEKDIQRSTVDDVIDEVIKGTATQFRNTKEANKKRATRQTGSKTEKNSTGDVRKSPRGVKRTRDRSLSDASMDSSDDNVKRDDNVTAKEPKLPKLTEPPAPPKSEPETIIKTIPVAPPVITAPLSIPTPITKPPKKMISEIAKLTSVFEAAANTNNRVRVASPSVPDRPLPLAERPCEAERLAPPAAETSPIAAGEAGDAGYVRRHVDNVPTNMMPVGATEATDARVQSPALPHRPPSTQHLVDRATPVLVRGGEGEGEGAAAGASRFRGAYAGPASLPRGAHHPPLAKQVAVVGPHHQLAGSRTPVTDEARFGRTSVPAGSPQGPIALSADLVRSPPPAHQQTSPIAVYHNGDGMYPHFSHHHYQMYQQHFRATQHENISTPTFLPRGALEAEASEVPTPPLELRRPPTARVPRPAHSPSLLDRHIMYAVRCGRSPPPAHGTSRPPSALPPPGAPGPPHASQVPREADSLQMLLRRYPVMWQGLLALKNDSAAVQMHFVGGNPGVAADALSRHSDGAAASLLRIAQRMRLEPAQLDQVHRKMKLENEHCILLALPCGRDHMDVLQQSTNLTAGFITYLQRKQAAGIVNVAPTPGHHQSIYTVHIFPSCDFANENLNRIAPDLMHRVANIAHLLIVIATALG
ncbi:protein split ends isoform X2 [Maniola jurtina]|uniref:protein split ends isoform X2 n=1 Tax=Maniola jurtina TaxID=191418 RepID=UPI001E68A826|nr:protein split ends isoform X2 [Maniola jurtina]